MYKVYVYDTESGKPRFYKEVLEMIKLCGLYIIVEFIDYITAVCCHLIMGDYKSHIAKVGAIKKFLLTVTIVALPLLTQLVKVVGNEIGVSVPPEILVFSSAFVVKQIATEISSIWENVNEVINHGSGSNTTV